MKLEVNLTANCVATFHFWKFLKVTVQIFHETSELHNS
jgi:hypothetical protein